MSDQHTIEQSLEQARQEMIEQEKSVFAYRSNEEFYDALAPEIIAYQQELAKKRLGIKFAILAMLKKGNFGYLKIQDSSRMMFIPDYDMQSFSNNIEVLLRHLVIISNKYKLYYTVNPKDTEATFMAESLNPELIEEIVLPPTHLIKCRSGVYNLKERKYTNELVNENGLRYFFAHQYDFDVLEENRLSKDRLNVIKKIHAKWGDGDDNKYRFIQDTLLGCLMGLDIKRQIVIEGPGGNGKSTFLNECKVLAGQNQYLDINMHDFDQDPIFGMIRPYHKLLAGDDLAVNWVMNTNVSTRFKQLIMGSVQLINQKYKDPMPVLQTGMKIQLTNDFMRMMERGQVMEDRLLYMRWSGENFRSIKASQEAIDMKQEIEDVFGVTLDNLVNPSKSTFTKYTYYTTLVSWLLSERKELPTAATFAEYASKFAEELEQALKGTQDSLDEFFDDCEVDGVFEQQIIPGTLLYVKYVSVLSTLNPGAKPVRIQSFLQRLSAKIKPMGYTKHYRARVRQLDITECNVREYLGGREISQIQPFDKIYSTLVNPMQLYEKENTHFLRHLDTQQRKLVMNELAVINDLNDIELFSLTYTELKQLWEKSKSQIQESWD